ncbi:MAG: type II/IV secretion system protein [Lentisphaerae bacterium]|jgi:type II secretion system protein E|nr:type II/IV secretion system protein [Lentisphaerota bacterium]MBT4821857.1 type II/IV secretion system protein [Lentisphaerota bacterium]MBT5605498.1 type II/IV secretion system protein [Lentisphaerota bacterium]MBT7060071.1 type II/IV secretion system protein [Lentisphaerota bacterium]MBT7840869.1 type II/IV secretion system protein [Lentisphaerota bacterium]
MDDVIADMVRAGQLPASDALRIRDALRERAGGAAEQDVLQAVAAEYGVPFSDLGDLQPDMALIAACPARLLLQWDVLPLRRHNGRVEVAVSGLFDTRGTDALRVTLGEPVVPVLAPSDAIRACIKTHLGVGADTIDSLESSAFLQVVEDSPRAGVDLDESAQDASIIRFVNQMLVDAIGQRATDVHLEPFEDEFRVRYRIDGVLQDVPVPPQLKRFQPAVVSRIKIVSDLDIAEKRLPQDGRIKLRLRGSDVDVRVSIIPMVHGEAVVLRLLRQDSALMGLGELDMAPQTLDHLRGLLGVPHGIILVTGPTGSGKTTTLYAALQELNDSERKIVTVEDPVEYQMNGINQIQVSEKTGLTFARGLRSILRHDPDIILVGEIRDAETAHIAVQASLTGHLVFSTLHTNDAPSALTRLVDMGVEPYLVASSLEAILAQRLVRLLCPHCRRPVTDMEREEAAAVSPVAATGPAYAAVGCSECRNTGYLGRHAIFELLPMTEEIAAMVAASRPLGEIRAAAVEQGWRPLFEDGLRLLRDGVTTLEEVLRVSRDTAATGNGATVESP